MSGFFAVTTTTDDRAVAERIAHEAVGRRLGACARISPASSVYRWRGGVETAEEFVVEIKTTAARRAALEALIGELQTYELPEIVVHELASGSERYFGWLSEACGDGVD